MGGWEGGREGRGGGSEVRSEGMEWEGGREGGREGGKRWRE